jgi:mannose-6-phosphate isomerase-like protein (cupin superfamily)
MALKKDFEAAEAAVRASESVGEFVTGWIPGAPTDLVGWATRKKAGLMGTAKSTHYTAPFRPFDLLNKANTPVVLLENDVHRIAVESVVGVQDRFHRYVDYDVVYFQFCGETKLETECGIYDVGAGELIIIPAGVAHRSIGKNDSLRYVCFSHESIEYVMDEDQYNSHTTFEMSRTGAPEWVSDDGEASPTDTVLEEMHFWNDGPDDLTTAEREYDSLIGIATVGPGQDASPVKKRRLFDHFTGISGSDGPDVGTQVLLEAPSLRIRTYNIIGEQFAFHRPLRSVELRIQFRGDALDLSEFDNVEVSPGKVTVIPLGISHSVVTVPPDAPDFLRLNFYSRLPWRTKIDPEQHFSDSTFNVTTKVLKEVDEK